MTILPSSAGQKKEGGVASGAPGAVPDGTTTEERPEVGTEIIVGADAPGVWTEERTTDGIKTAGVCAEERAADGTENPGVWSERDADGMDTVGI